MTATDDKKKIAIIGAGISGLSLAWYLKKRYQEKIAIQIFEASNRGGGWVRSSNSQAFFFEYGPRAFRAADSEAAYSLVQELGLEPAICWAETQQRHIYYKKQLHPLPKTFKEFCRSPLTEGCLKEMLKDIFLGRSIKEDMSVYDFFIKKFGPNIVERFVNPFISGIYAGNAKKLSIQHCFPDLIGSRSILLKVLFTKKSKKKGLWSLKGGIESLIQALIQQTDAELLLNRLVTRLQIKQNQVILTDEKGTYVFDHLFCTLPMPKLKQILNCPLPSLPYTSVAVVHLGFNSQVSHPKSFGYLVPENEGEKILGIVFDSAVFPHQGKGTRLTVMIGGEKNRELVDISDDELLKIAKSALFEHLAIKQAPDFCHVFRASECIPQFPVGYQKIKDFPTLSFLGTSFSGISLNQLIMAAKSKADAVELFKNAAWHQNCV